MNPHSRHLHPRLCGLAVHGCLLLTIMALWPRSTLAADSPAAVLDDGYFGWDTRELSIADAQAAVRQFAKLAAHEALILDRCGLHSVNPRLAALLLVASGALEAPGSDGSEAMRARIDAFLTALPHLFYLGRANAAVPAQGLNVPRESTASATSESAGVNALADTFLTGDERAGTLARTYLQRFGVRTPVASASLTHGRSHYVS